MPVRVTLDDMLRVRGMMAKDLARQIGISETQLSLFRNNRIKGVRTATLAAMCAALSCRPGDLLDYDFDPADVGSSMRDGSITLKRVKV